MALAVVKFRSGVKSLDFGSMLSNFGLHFHIHVCRKLQGAMQIVAMAETVIYMNMDDSSKNSCLRLLIREWAQLCIFSCIG
ncbi:hypothetical protein QN277_016173 [Acacia crassicarpa]|uniref:Uncharacterized protein n=1 Tax=Acacia crassicarpa TaxID=499986 RepID=A0AAE1MW32_9FABA|nr:hypothetical protein QN277_016173 [Acacia crassicarpa]